MTPASTCDGTASFTRGKSTRTASGGRFWRGRAIPRSLSDAVAEVFAQAARRGTAIEDIGRWVWKAAFRIAAGMLADRRRDNNRGLPGVESVSGPMLTDEVHVLVDALPFGPKIASSGLADVGGGRPKRSPRSPEQRRARVARDCTAAGGRCERHWRRTMVDLIDEAFAVPERVEAPVTWDDVLAGQRRQ